MGDYHIAWRAQGVLTVPASTPERAAELADERLHDALTDDLGVEEVTLLDEGEAP